MIETDVGGKEMSWEFRGHHTYVVDPWGGCRHLCDHDETGASFSSQCALVVYTSVGRP